jgi:hypothetical protein
MRWKILRAPGGGAGGGGGGGGGPWGAKGRSSVEHQGGAGAESSLNTNNATFFRKHILACCSCLGSWHASGHDIANNQTLALYAGSARASPVTHQ